MGHDLGSVSTLTEALELQLQQVGRLREGEALVVRRFLLARLAEHAVVAIHNL